MEYGLIGASLSHSFSKPIHESLCGYSYELRPLPTQADFDAFLRARDFKAVNVTIPYKQAVMPYCDKLDARAAAVGAVNTLVNRGGALYGYNTDYAGFLYLAARTNVCFAGKHVMILGTGGTQHTVRAVVTDAGAASVTLVSRTPQAAREISPVGAADGKTAGTPAVRSISYADVPLCTQTQILINTTPAGMYPNNDTAALSLSSGILPRLEAVLDAVYNPLRTRLVLDAQARGLRAAGGLAMLVAQAKYAAEIFTGSALPESEIARILCEMTQQRTNLILIGMPGSGKSCVGRQAAALLHRPFLDLDAELVARAGKSIADIFAQEGEEAFRLLETQLCMILGRETGRVISTGGGTILRDENVRALRQNGVLLALDRPLEALQTGGGRPLSANAAAVAALYKARAPLYRAAAQRIVPNRTSPEAAARATKEAFDEIIDSERA